jgi:hypothetical protein
MGKGVGITAIRRVIEDTCRKRVEDENERRSKGRNAVVKSITEWALSHSPLAKAVISGLMLEVSHALTPRNPYSYSCGSESMTSVEVKLRPTGRENYNGNISHNMALPSDLVKAAHSVRELRIEDLKSTSELLASRVLLKGEGGNIERHIAQVVDFWIKELAK